MADAPAGPVKADEFVQVVDKTTGTAEHAAGPIPAEEFVAVADKTSGVARPDPIPKHWIGTDLAPNVEQVRVTSTPAVEPPSADLGPPAKSAEKAAWVVYAVEQGMPQASAETATKEKLIAAYGQG